MKEHFYESGSCVQKKLCQLRGSPHVFSPSSVQLKSEINGALPRKRHQTRHLEFCTAYLLSSGSRVRVSPGAPLFWNSLKQYELDKTAFTPTICFFDRWSGMTKLWLSRSFLSRSNCLREPHQLCMRRESRAVIKM